MKLRTKIALATGISLSPIIATTALAGCSQEWYKEYHIVTINDLHGAVPGFGEDVSVVDPTNPGCFRLQKEVNKVLDKHPGSVFLSAGDENSGDSWSTCSHGQTTYPILKTMGVRYCAVGNHAFEWGINDVATGLYDRLGRTDQTEGKYFVTSNIFSIPGYNEKTDWVINQKSSKFKADFDLWNKSRVAWADPYKILNFGDAKVCLIGLTTTGTIKDSNKEVTKKLSFVDYNASVNYTKYLAKQELGDEAYNAIDSFILFTHCAGQFNEKTQAIEGEVADLAANITTDVDAIISAHSHKQFCGTIKNTTTGKDIWLAQAGTAGRAFSDTTLIINPNKKPGQRLKSITMALNQVPVPTNEEEAKAEWKRYCNSNNSLSALANTYNYERQWVSEFFSRELSKSTLDDNDTSMQEPTKFKGYYNGLISAIDPFTKVKAIPGHDYFCSDKIIDHFNGWITRAQQIGFYYINQEDIKSNYGAMPSCCFTTQDTAPAQLVNGDITVKEVYDMIRYDNTTQVSYVGILQLANILNYSLAGQPNADQTEGFKYHAERFYKPDLNMFFGNTSSKEQLESSKHKVCESTEINTTNYLCGPLSQYGIKYNIVPITDVERELTYVNPDTGEERPVYDLTAKYRVATKPYDIVVEGGAPKTVWLPEIKIFEYKLNDDGTDNIADLDDPSTESWHEADYWYAKEYATTLQEHALIPVLTNNFLYGGGNDQTKMFKIYQQFNKEKFSRYYFDYSSTLTIRDLLEKFLIISVDQGYDWTKDGRAPTNIPWSIIHSMINDGAL